MTIILKFMCFQLVAPMKFFPTYLTLEKLKVQMSALVVLFITVGDKSLAAETTDEGLFACMCLNMMR
jgi:hypothetical protein